MGTAYLTIDDGPTIMTKDILDFLLNKDIIPLMFFWGDRIKEERQNGIYAIKNGAIIGNHSNSHPHFSEISLEQCIEEIEQNEVLINGLYEEAGVKREYKIFRFPYGDKGGENKAALQEYLASHGFCQIDYTPITYDWYYSNQLDKDLDTLWTFDFEEYRLSYDKDFSYNSILEHMDNPNPEQGGNLKDVGAHNIFLIHDHPHTDAIVPGYFYDLINRSIDAGTTFVKPKFLS